jgi:hypothetical protein
MASYTAAQLAGTGSLGENLSGLKTFAFTNPSGSSYFTMETIPGSNNLYYTGVTPTNFLGTYNVSASMGLVKDSYVAAVVVQPGVSSFTFAPASAVTGTTYRLKGTGDYSLTII